MPIDNAVSLGKALTLLRSRRNLTRSTVAEMAGMTPLRLSAYERGICLPSLPSLVPVLTILGSDLRDLQDVLDEVEGLNPGRREAASGH
ncbi:MAG TPA: helix-turn-helix transcriptional regulator [Thermoanaerobaculia bacterium]|nr:helix-turn-helix transcriptional regulator [Thermoanaerobaculia bacterium]